MNEVYGQMARRSYTIHCIGNLEVFHYYGKAYSARGKTRIIKYVSVSILKQRFDARGVRAAARARGLQDDLLRHVVQVLHLLEVPALLLALPVVDLPVDVVHLAQRPLLPVPLRVQVARQLAPALERFPAVPASIATPANS